MTETKSSRQHPYIPPIVVRGTITRVSTQKTCPICFYYPTNFQERPPRLRLFLTRITPRYHELHLDIFLRSRDCGHEITFVDVSQFNYPQQSRTLEQTGTVGQFLGLQELVTLRPNWGNWGASKDREIFTEQGDSIQSEIRTKYGGRTNSLLERLDSNLLSFFSSELFNQLSEIQPQSEVWIVTNGRLAHQRAIVARAKTAGIRILYLEEIGFPPGYFLRPYSPHNRVLLQSEVIERYPQTSRRDMELATSWFEERSAHGSELNKYSKRFSAYEKDNKLAASGQKIGFFTSSSDELLGLGSSWLDAGWTSQYEAFGAIAPILQNLGYEIYLRIHPNFANKSARDLRIELRQIQAFAIATKVWIVGPKSHISSYRLIHESVGVVTPASTIGLEALSWGKKTILTDYAVYDQLPGVFQALGNFNQLDLAAYLIEETTEKRPSPVDWAAVQLLLNWNPVQHLESLPANPIRGKLRFLFNPTFIASKLSLMVAGLLNAFSRPKILASLRKLEKLSATTL